ncbi:uncharacterized protein LOC133784736 [Humulus lupulus]|uniref:uncharacterized protein LOC133784736 n=1 Tax=Humulus lupulus TaxID=3486 RepID=UPI002B4033E6|nr:uncharacterized protein LOC133784736 [Humulus lupulus]
MAREGGTQRRSTTVSATFTDDNPFFVLDQPNRSSTDVTRSPYYFSNGDHSRANLVSKILIGGENYNSWKRSMMISLLAKNKLKFINGKLPQPDSTDDDYDIWCRCNSMVISWILHVISPNIVDSVMYLDDVVANWSELHDHFHQNNGPQVFQVKRSMQALVQGSNDVTTASFTRLKAHWDL